MRDPIQIEYFYQELLQYLSFPSTTRERLLRINRFIEQIGRDPFIGESYLLDLVQRIPAALKNLNVIGTEPHLVKSFYEFFQVLREYYPEVSSLKDYEDCLSALQKAAAQLYVYAGSLEMFLTILKEPRSDHLQVLYRTLDPKNQRNPYEKLGILLKIAQRENCESFDTIQAVYQDWSEQRKRQTKSVIVPVVEYSLYDSENRESGGTLRKIGIRIFGKSSSSTDEFQTDVALFGTRGDEINMPVITKAVRTVVREYYPSLEKRFISAHVSFDNNEAMHEGRSANLAIAALLYCTILRYFDQRSRYDIGSRVAITGDIDEHGNVLPIENSSIHHKVRAVMFSWLDILVVPKDQLETAVLAMRQCGAYYPGRQIEIIGIGHLRELFFDRRLTNRRKINWISYTRRRVGKQKYGVLYGLSVIVLLYIIFHLWFEPFDRNPVRGVYEGESLFVYNKNDRIIDEIYIGPIGIYDSGSDDISATFLRKLVAFRDVTGDGINELIYGIPQQSEINQLSSVVCRSIKERRNLWSFSIKEKLEFKYKSNIVTDNFNVNQLLVEDYFGKGEMDVVVIGRHHYFPNLVLLLDGREGERKAAYVHMGGIIDAVAADINGNNIKEIVLVGINNSLETAAISVLDPRFISGHSPLTEEYTVLGYEPGTEMYYIQIPRTLVGNVFRYAIRYNLPMRLTHLKQSEMFRISMLEVHSYGNSPFEINTATYFVYLDHKFKYVSAGTGDDYDLMARRLYDTGNIQRMPDYNYFRDYGNSLLYWDGNGWEKKPIINGRYSESILSAEISRPE